MIHTKKGYTTQSGDISLSFLFVVRQTCGVSDTEAYRTVLWEYRSVKIIYVYYVFTPF